MGDYSQFILPERRPRPAPKSLVGPRGSGIFGSFDFEIADLSNLTKLNHPTRLPNFCNRFRLTLWEAAEVHLRHGVLLTAVSDMGFFGKILTIFYDKRTHQTYCWDTTLGHSKTKIAPHLLNGAVSEAHTPVSRVKFVNYFDKSRARLKGRQRGKCLVTKPNPRLTAVEARSENATQANIEYDFTLQRLSLPSVASIPFDSRRPRLLYSQKDFFKASGTLSINGEQMRTDEDSTAIIDDHRGYYPRRSHYDWLTTLGRYDLGGGERGYLAFNLTHNQSIDPSRFSENQLWLEGRSSLLPPVKFVKSIPTAEFRDRALWEVSDEYDMVNLKFEVQSLHPMVMHAWPAVMIDYFVTFGTLAGYVRDEDGRRYDLDGCLGMGEDKSLLF